MADAKSKLRVLAALGPGNLLESFQFWRDRKGMPSQTGIPYSHQFFDLSQDLDFKAWAISSHPNRGVAVSNNLTVENRPKRWQTAAGARYHLAQLVFALSLLRSALVFRPHIVMIDSGETHYFLCSLFRIAGCKVVANFHNVIWPRGFPPTKTSGKALLWLDSFFFRYFCSACQGVSMECSRQANTLANRQLPFFLYYGQFAEQDFDSFEHAANEQGKLRVIYAGRLEKAKGVFDIVEAADILRSRPNCHITFEVCGEGGVIDELRQTVRERGLESTARILGALNRADLIEAYRRNHVVLVPTQNTFQEGLAKVAVEAILARRPVVTTGVVPALEILRPACLEVRPNDPASIADCLEKLASSPALVLQLSRASDPLRRMFVDGSNSYYNALKKTIEALR